MDLRTCPSLSTVHLNQASKTCREWMHFDNNRGQNQWKPQEIASWWKQTGEREQDAQSGAVHAQGLNQLPEQIVYFCELPQFKSASRCLVGPQLAMTQVKIKSVLLKTIVVPKIARQRQTQQRHKILHQAVLIWSPSTNSFCLFIETNRILPIADIVERSPS